MLPVLKQGGTFLRKKQMKFEVRYHKIKDIALIQTSQIGRIVALKTGVRKYFLPEGYVTKMALEMER